MICKNCGNNVNDGQLFCPSCGSRISDDSAAPEAANVNNGFAPPSGLGESNAPAGASSYAPQGQSGYAHTPEPPSPTVSETAPVEPGTAYKADDFVGGVEPVYRKKPKGKKIFFSVVAVVLVAAIGLGVWFFGFRNDYSSKDPKDKLKTIQVSAVDKYASRAASFTDIVDDFGEVMLTLFGDGTISADNMFLGLNGAGVEVTIGDEIKGKLEEEIGMPGSMSWLNSAGIDGDIIINQSALGLNLGFSMNSTDIVTAKCVLDSTDKSIYLSSPELLTKSLKIPNAFDMSDLEYELAEMKSAMEELKSMLAYFPEADKLEKMANNYLGAIIGALNDVKEAEKNVEVEGVSQKQVVLTAKITPKTVTSIVKALVKEAKSDEDLHNIIRDFAAAQGLNGDDIINKLKGINDSQINEFCDSIENSMPEFEAYLDCYTGKEGELYGIGIRYESLEIAFRNVENGSKTATELVFVTPEGQFGFSGNGEMNGDILNGTYSIKFNGMNLVDITATNLNSKKLDEGDLEGTLTIAFSDEANNILSGLGVYTDLSMLTGIKLELTGSAVSDTESNLKIAVYTNESLFVSLDIKTRSKHDATVDIPADYLEINPELTDEGEFFSIISIDPLIANLQSAGLPSEYIEMLSSGLVPSAEDVEEDSEEDFIIEDIY
ncbi:MAG: hypothetical protein II998_09295 [Clostridia bacterium]|nr:hypothetical protein [Clostridia bacterium]